MWDVGKCCRFCACVRCESENAMYFRSKLNLCSKHGNCSGCYRCFPCCNVALTCEKWKFHHVDLHAYVDEEPSPRCVYHIVWPWYAYSTYAHVGNGHMLSKIWRILNANVKRCNNVKIAFDSTRYHRLYNVRNWIWKSIINHRTVSISAAHTEPKVKSSIHMLRIIMNHGFRFSWRTFMLRDFNINLPRLVCLPSFR